jgi:hypothetical protein
MSGQQGRVGFQAHAAAVRGGLEVGAQVGVAETVQSPVSRLRFIPQNSWVCWRARVWKGAVAQEHLVAVGAWFLAELVGASVEDRAHRLCGVLGFLDGGDKEVSGQVVATVRQ